MVPNSPSPEPYAAMVPKRDKTLNTTGNMFDAVRGCAYAADLRENKREVINVVNWTSTNRQLILALHSYAQVVKK